MPTPAPSRPLPTPTLDAEEKYIGLPIPSPRLDLSFNPPIPPTTHLTQNSMPKQSSVNVVVDSKAHRRASRQRKAQTVQFVAFPPPGSSDSHSDEQKETLFAKVSPPVKSVHVVDGERRNRIKHRQHRHHRSVDVHFDEREDDRREGEVTTVRRSITMSFAGPADDPPIVRKRTPSTPQPFAHSPSPPSSSSSNSTHSSSSSRSTSPVNDESEKPLPKHPFNNPRKSFLPPSHIRAQCSVEVLVALPPPASPRHRKHPSPVIIQSQSQSFTLLGGLKAIWKKASTHARYVKQIPVSLTGKDPERDSVLWNGFVKVPATEISSPSPPPLPSKSFEHTRQTIYIPSSAPPPPIKSNPPVQRPSLPQRPQTMSPPPRKVPPPLPPRSSSALDGRISRGGRAPSALGYNPRNAIVITDDRMAIRV